MSDNDDKKETMFLAEDTEFNSECFCNCMDLGIQMSIE